MSRSKSTILQRVREALAQPTDQHVRKLPIVTPVMSDKGDDFAQWLPLVDDAYESRKALFGEWSEKLKTRLICVPSFDAAQKVVAQRAAEESWQRVATHEHDQAMTIASSLDLPLLATDDGYEVAALEQCDAGITGCDALIAQTGSILVTSRSAGGRALSVLPPHHVVIATRDQLIADLVAGFALLRERYSDSWPSFMSLITGPSRTGDIERILVLGAHGPKKVTVVLIER